tara:strand:+ start:877 stop:1239 length:363 start_codon:yes stop_codon:yes gene_type:complete
VYIKSEIRNKNCTEYLIMVPDKSRFLSEYIKTIDKNINTMALYFNSDLIVNAYNTRTIGIKRTSIRIGEGTKIKKINGSDKSAYKKIRPVIRIALFDIDFFLFKYSTENNIIYLLKLLIL